MGLTPEQEACTRCLDRPLVVAAGAGSGKTHMLTERVVWAFSKESGPFLHSLDELLMVTFTEKAAAEMRGRVRNSLRRAGHIDEALKADGARISTIHGMCSRILHEHALEAHIDPGFQVVMPGDARAYRDRALTTVLDRIDGSDGLFENLADLFDAYGTYATGQLVVELLDKAASLTRGLAAFDVGPAPAEPSGLLRSLLEAGEAGSRDWTAKTAQTAEQLADALRQLLASNASPTWEDVVLSLDGLKSLKPRKCGSDEQKEAIAELQNLLKALELEALMSVRFDRAGALLELARKVEDEYRATMMADGLIDTADLIRRTHDLLMEKDAVAQSYRDRFKMVMVDEFQDTSQLQIETISALVGVDCRHLCTVGDAQQSIYRFQGADVNVYLDHKRGMESPAIAAETHTLGKNFRSHGDILSFVRTVCGQSDYFVDDFLDLQPDELRTDGYLGSAPRIELVLAENRSHKGSINDARAQLAATVADRFATLRDEGHDPGDMVVLLQSTTKADIYADALRSRGFAVTLSGGSQFYRQPEVIICRNLLHALANPLESACLLPLFTGEPFPMSSDDLLELGTVDREPSESMDPETDRKTHPMRRNIGTALLGNDVDGERLSAPARHAIRVLRDSWKKIGAMPPSRIFEECLIDSGWLARMEAGGIEGQAQAGNVLKYVRMMRDVEAESGFDMRRVTRAMDDKAENTKEKQGALSVNERAVRIMTIHASKGLEFSIVAVGIDNPRPPKWGSLVTSVDLGDAYCSLKPPKSEFDPDASFIYDDASRDPKTATTPGAFLSILKQREIEGESAEVRRLFYVAATRAREALIVGLAHTRSSDNHFTGVPADILHGCFGDAETDFPGAETTPYTGSFSCGGDTEARFTRLLFDSDVDDAEPAPESPNDADRREAAKLDIPPAFTSVRPAMRYRRTRADFFSYSLLSTGDEHVPAEPAPNAGPRFEADDAEAARHDARPVRDADSATDFGSALHRCCEWLALQPTPPTDTAIADALLRFAAEFGVKDGDRLRAAFDRWRESDICEQALNHDSHLPETPFCLAVDDWYLDGEIDLLCRNHDDGGALVVDYKTGGSDDETAEALQAKHRLQSACYAAAVLSAGASDVDLCFVRVERSDEHRPAQPQIVRYSHSAAELPKLLEEIRAAHATLAERKRA